MQTPSFLRVFQHKKEITFALAGTELPHSTSKETCWLGRLVSACDLLSPHSDLERMYLFASTYSAFRKGDVLLPSLK